ncbi:MAG: substrate-binding domain-containing protein [Janthinobacterium sp.]
MSGAQWNSTSGERLTGYRRALAAAGVAIDERLVAYGESSIEPARLAVHALLALPDRPSAIVSGNNLMTLGAMRALKEAGVAIPGEIAFAGFDDLDWADLHSPSLTVTAQPLEDIGARAVSLLIRRMREPDAARSVVRMPVTMRVRRPCGCP